MAASFVSGSSQRLINAAPPLPSTGYPLTVGAWVYPTSTASARRFFSYGDTAAGLNYMEIGHGSGGTWQLTARDGATTSTASAGTVVANDWTFLLGGFSTSTVRRLYVLGSTQNTLGGDGISISPAGLDTMALGARTTNSPSLFWHGLIGEFWYCAADFGAFSSGQVRQLAYGGPFSIPDIASKVIEYRSLRTSRTAGEGRDVYVGAGAHMQVWSNVNGVTTGPHPPLPYWYANPRQRRVLLPF